VLSLNCPEIRFVIAGMELMGGAVYWEQFARWQKHPYTTMDLSENCYMSCLRECDWYL